VIQVDAEPAREYARRSAREEGMLVGISSGATLAAIAQKLPELPAGAKVLGFNYDTGERYLSVEGFPAGLFSSAALTPARPTCWRCTSSMSR
jgi:cysteine synthase A